MMRGISGLGHWSFAWTQGPDTRLCVATKGECAVSDLEDLAVEHDGLPLRVLECLLEVDAAGGRQRDVLEHVTEPDNHTHTTITSGTLPSAHIHQKRVRGWRSRHETR